MSMVNLVTCYFHSFEALNDAFEVHIFSGLHFYPLPDTDSMQLRFFKVKTLLNDAFSLSNLNYRIDLICTDLSLSLYS